MLEKEAWMAHLLRCSMQKYSLLFLQQKWGHYLKIKVDGYSIVFNRIGWALCLVRYFFLIKGASTVMDSPPGFKKRIFCLDVVFIGHKGSLFCL